MRYILYDNDEKKYSEGKLVLGDEESRHTFCMNAREEGSVAFEISNGVWLNLWTTDWMGASLDTEPNPHD